MNLARYDRPPFAIYVPGKAGTVTPDEAANAFGPAFDDHAEYIRDDDGFIRMKYSEDTARANNMNRMFDGSVCRHGHISLRRVRPRSRYTECMACHQDYKRRSKRS